MANATAKVPTAQTVVIDEKRKGLVVTTAQTYYNGAMLGWNSSDLLDKFDDSQSLVYAGILEDAGPVVITSASAEADRRVTVAKRRRITMAISSAAASDRGRRVYAAYDGTATYSVGTYSNFIGYMDGLVNGSTTNIHIDTLTNDGGSTGGEATFESITAADASLDIAGKASTTAAGGAVAVTGGASSFATGVGGAFTATGGAGGANAVGGAITLLGGSPSAGNAAGAVASMTGGTGLGTGNGGVSKVVGGTAGATGSGGAAQVIGGLAIAGVGGAVVITGGLSVGATNSGPAVTITGGNSGGASGTGGAVNLASGDAAGGTVGAVNVQTVALGKLGFYGATAIVIPSGNGTQATTAAGATTAIYLNTTLTGGVGSTAYTTGDIVKCLKQLGLITT